MKNILLFFGLIMTSFSISAQDKSETVSNVERFCQSSGKIIQGQLLYSDSYDKYSDNGVLLVKYMDSEKKDTVFSIGFFGTAIIELGYNHGLIKKPYKVYLDYKEKVHIMSWIEFVKQHMNEDSKNDYYAYSPMKGSILFYVKKSDNSSKWIFGIQYDKSDLLTAKELNVDYLNDLYLKLTEIQKAKDADNKK